MVCRCNASIHSVGSCGIGPCYWSNFPVHVVWSPVVRPNRHSVPRGVIMRVYYRDFWGRKVCVEFSSVWDMWVWVKRWYPIVKGFEEMGEFIDQL